MDPSIHHELILALDQTDLNGGFSLAEEELPRITDVAWRLGWPGGAHVGLGGGPKWVQGPLSHPLGSLAHVCHHFGQIFPYFLHTNNSTSTSGTR